MPPAPSEIERERLSDAIHIRLLALDYRRVDTSWNTANVRSSFWRLYRNDQDGAGVVWRDGFYPLTAGRVHFVPAWVHFTCKATAPVDHFYVHFDLIGLPGSLVRQAFGQPITLPRSAALESSWDELKTLDLFPQQKNFATLCLCKSAVYQSLFNLLRTLSKTDLEMCSRFLQTPEAIRQAILHIEAHLNEPIGNDGLAELCGMSSDHFIRIFKKSMGQTPAQYVLERRVADAARRLLFSDDSIETIAERCGFPNRFYFTRAFKRRLGTSPAAYRNTERV